MKARDLREMDTAQVQVHLAELQAALGRMREAVRGGSEKNSAQLRRLRRGVARAETVLREQLRGG